MKKNAARVSSVISDEEIRTTVVRELGLEQLDTKDQDEIMEIMREAIMTRIDTSLLQALGPEGVRALGEIPEDNDTLFAQKLSAALPNLADVVKNAITESIVSYRESVMRALGKH